MTTRTVQLGDQQHADAQVNRTTSIALGEIMPAKSGSVDPTDFPNEVFDLYSIPAFDTGQPEVLTGREIGSTKQVVQPGDALLSKIVPHIRRCWVVGKDRGRRLIASSEWIVFRSDKAHPDYLRHVLVGDQFHSRFMQTVSGVGGSLLRARPGYVAEIEIPLPPLSEQQRIAGVLEQADRLRRTRRYALELSDAFLPAAFRQLFGDPAKNDRRWDRAKVSELGKVETGSTPPRENSDYYGDAIEWIKSDNISLDQIHPAKATEGLSEIGCSIGTTVGAGSLLLTCIAGSANSIGNVVLTNRRVAFNQQINSVTPSKGVDPLFLYGLFIAAKPLIQRSTTLAMKRMITKGKLEELVLIRPPLALQQQFASLVSRHERLRAVQRESLRQAEHLFQSLLHRAFTTGL